MNSPYLARPAQQKRPGILERIQNAMMPAPQSGGLLSEADIKSARTQGLLGLGAGLLANSGPKTAAERVGLMQSVGQGIQGAQGAYQGALQGAMGQRMAEQQHALGGAELAQRTMALQQAGQQAQIRKSIMDKHGQPPAGDANAMASWIDQVTPDLIRHGLTEDLGRLSEVRKSIGAQGQKEPGTWITVPGPDGKPMARYITASQAGPQGVQEYEKPTRDAGATLLDEQRMFTRAQQLDGDYRTTTKSIQAAADQFRTMVAMAEGAKAGSPQAQIGLIFSYMKTLDPGSVVRESEYATASNAAGVPERVRNQYNKVLDGTFLTPEQVDGFLAAGRGSAAQWRRQQDLHRKTFGQRAQRWGISPDDVTIDFFDGLDLEPARPAGMPGVVRGSSSTAPAGGVGGLKQRYGGLR
jgi:hypothetical protein